MVKLFVVRFDLARLPRVDSMLGERCGWKEVKIGESEGGESKAGCQGVCGNLSEAP